MPRELHAYFYWRVAPEATEAAVNAVAAWQARLRADHAGLHCALYQRPPEGTSTGLTTVMEVYGPVQEGSPTLAALLLPSQCLSEPWRQGERHLELFEAVPPTTPPLG
jgi:hypothetical protein